MKLWFHCSPFGMAVSYSRQAEPRPGRMREVVMVEMTQALRPQAAPPPKSLREESRSPHCCGQEMHILLRRAVLHSDGSVDFQTAWGCRCCGRRIL